MKNDNTPTFLDVHPYPPPKTTTTSSSSSYERVLLLLLSTPPPLHQSIYRLIRGAAAVLLFSGTFTVDLCGDSGQGHQHHARFVGIGPNSSSGNDRHALHESHAKLSAEAFPGCQGRRRVCQSEVVARLPAKFFDGTREKYAKERRRGGGNSQTGINPCLYSARSDSQTRVRERLKEDE